MEKVFTEITKKKKKKKKNKKRKKRRRRRRRWHIICVINITIIKISPTVKIEKKNCVP